MTKLRKLNAKNKIYIYLLSAFTLLLFIILSIFIVRKFIDMNIKYEIKANSYVYNTDNELVHVTSDTYVKKGFTSNYYLYLNENKINIGSNPVFIQNDTKEISMFGIFYQIMDNGEVTKLTGLNTLKSTVNDLFYKISDRKYLIVAPSITSEDNSLNTNNFLLVNIDKQGNGYLYNHEVNMKTFNELLLKTGDYEFNVNEEMLTLGDEDIDLAKINGSTNQYVRKEKDENGEGTGGGEGGNGSGGGGSEEENVPEVPTQTITTKEVKKETISEDSYIFRKTSILNIESTTDTITINYTVYDPFSEFDTLYVRVNGVDIPMDMGDSKLELKNLNADTEYVLYFYYTYGGFQNDTLFDSHVIKTKGIKANISLVKVTQNDVTYNVKVDDYLLDECKVAIYVDGVLQNSKNINTISALNGGYEDKIEFNGTGNFAVLKLEGCSFNGKAIEMNTSYKFKL